MAVKIFFCYAHEDEDLLNKLKRHLWPLQRQGLIDVWHDRDISAGTEWEQEISQQLNAAHIILLLVSPDFMYSEYCYSVEMKRAIERHQRGKARVIPVILRHVYWQGEPLGKLQALPTDAKPVMSALWHNLDEALFDVTEGIRTVVVQLGTQPVSPPTVLPSQASKQESADVSHTALSPQPAKPLPSLKTEAVSSEVLPSQVSKGESESDSHTVLSPPPAKPLPSPKPKALSLLRTLTTGHKYSLSSVAFSPDGQTLASGSWDETIKLWNLTSGQELRTLTGHRAVVLSVAFSPNGQTLASGSVDKTIKLWNLARREVRTLTGHANIVSNVAFSPDGQTLASGGVDKTIKIWGMK